MTRRTFAILAVLAVGLLPLLATPTSAAAEVGRVAGEDRIETAVELSRTSFDVASVAVVADAWTFADALAAAPLAVAAGGPVLLNERDRLDGRVERELDRLGVETVYLMGGEAAQGPDVQAALERDRDVVRFGGDDRFATAALAANEAAKLWRAAGDADAGDHVLVALGRHPESEARAWPDALVAGVLAGYGHRPVLLTERDQVPEATNQAIEDLGASRVTVVGGPAAIPSSTQGQLGSGVSRDRIGGTDRYDTARLLAQQAASLGADLDVALLSTGLDFPDSLGAAPAAVARGGVLLLVHPEDLDRGRATAEVLWTRRDSITQLTLTGGTQAIPRATADQITARVNGLDGLTLRAAVWAAPGMFSDPLGLLAADEHTFVFERGRSVGGEQTMGRIWLADGGTKAAVPFLEVPTRTDGERGLLGVAFHPDYPSDPRVFVHHSHSGDGDTVLAEYRASSDGTRADPGSRRELLRVDQRAANHNGGTLAFGPDRMLYLFLGDEGGSNDTFDNAQDITTLPGSVLRLDVATPGVAAAASDNPFVGRNGDDRIWALGLRNPFRAGFDPVTGEAFVADVGQSGWEEVDLLPPGIGGINYGWPCREGNHPGPGSTKCPGEEALTSPLHEYARSGGECAIIGGEVYRGSAIGELRGHFLFGDLCSGMIGSLRSQSGSAAQITDWTADLVAVGSPRSFGIGADGELYVMNTSTIFRVERS